VQREKKRIKACREKVFTLNTSLQGYQLTSAMSLERRTFHLRKKFNYNQQQQKSKTATKTFDTSVLFAFR